MNRCWCMIGIMEQQPATFSSVNERATPLESEVFGTLRTGSTLYVRERGTNYNYKRLELRLLGLRLKNGSQVIQGHFGTPAGAKYENQKFMSAEALEAQYEPVDNQNFL